MTDTDRQTAHQACAALMRAVSEPGALLPLYAVPHTRPLGVLLRVTTILRALRWGLYPGLVCAGLMANRWFLAGVPLIFLLDRAVLGYLQVRLGVELAARVQVFNDLTLEEIQPCAVEPPWPPAEPFPPFDR